jgi:hypothetical protein
MQAKTNTLLKFWIISSDLKFDLDQQRVVNFMLVFIVGYHHFTINIEMVGMIW